MRMILFFDLPSISTKDKREYRKFVKGIKKFGFVMLQESVYSKLALNQTNVNSTMKEVKKILPRDGIITILTITEKQFSSMDFLIGSPNTDVISTEERLVRL